MKLRSWTDDQLIKAVTENISYHSTLIALNLVPRGGNYASLRHHIARLNLDTTHWYRAPREARGAKNILTKNSPYHAVKYIRIKVLKEKLIDYVCAKCGIGPSWNNQELTLQLDHINGKREDNELENLRFLCPNCHSQTNTWCWRNRYGPKVSHYCQECKAPVSKKSDRCRSCSQRNRYKSLPRVTKIVWPSVRDLKAMLDSSNYESVARSLDVSSNAIRKHLKYHDRISSPDRTD